MDAIKVGIVGAGGLGRHLAAFFQAHPAFDLQAVVLRPGAHPPGTKGIPPTVYVHDPYTLPAALDWLLLAVPDRALTAMAETMGTLPAVAQTLVCHCSATQPLNAINGFTSGLRGVFYPLQTFSRENVRAWDAPLFLESTPEAKPLLETYAAQFGVAAHWASHAQRVRLHIGAVVASNYMNRLWHHALHIATQLAGAKPNAYDALFAATVANWQQNPPAQTLTGPARRGDKATIEAHLRILENEYPAFATIYTALAQEIMAAYPPMHTD